jgi:SAM-dependent methyltransferase
MPNYGEKGYWDTRYEDDDVPFDWLFDYIELKGIIDHLLPNKNEQLFLVGCGNAPFSHHLEFIGNYTNIWNTDISPVVIEQQGKLYPNQRWEVIDVVDMPIPDNSVPVIIDKSLVDTLLCCSGTHDRIEKMMSEIHRILAPGSRFISFSLHPIEEVLDKYDLPDLYTWKTSFFRIKSKRWNPGKNRKRSTAHTMIVCDMPSHKRQLPRQPLLADVPLETLFPGLALTKGEDAALKKSVEPVLFKAAMKLATTDTILYCLYDALYQYTDALKEETDDEDKKTMQKLRRQFDKWKRLQDATDAIAEEEGTVAEAESEVEAELDTETEEASEDNSSTTTCSSTSNGSNGSNIDRRGV